MSTKKTDAEIAIGGFSDTSKMPWLSYSIPASRCQVGGRLVLVKGSVCEKCYALKGKYAVPNVDAALERRFSSLSDPFWVPNFVTALRERMAKEPNAPKYFRWHDAGDLASVAHLDMICNVAELMPDVSFWLPTKEYATVKRYMAQGGKIPTNLTIRMSAHLVDSKAPAMGFPTSTVHHEQEPVGVECRASSQGNQCLDCRACWDPTVANVSYPKH